MSVVSVTHTTRLDYSADVVEAVMDTRLGPFSDAHQRWDAFSLRAAPGGGAPLRGRLRQRGAPDHPQTPAPLRGDRDPGDDRDPAAMTPSPCPRCLPGR